MTDPPPERDPRTYILIGAAMEVHRIVGGGFGESIVTAALAIELQLRKVPFMTEVPFPIIYRGHRLPSTIVLISSALIPSSSKSRR